jgi:hypothetical protein
VRVYCQRLLEMEYLVMVAAGNGRPCLYQLVEPGCDDRPQLNGLAEILTMLILELICQGQALTPQINLTKEEAAFFF